LITKKNSQFQQYTSFDLKLTCLKLLREALNCEELKSSVHNQIKNKIIEVFFNYLAFRGTTKIVSVVKSGLSSFISKQRLPKDLLQQSLRPILSNLSSYSKLTLPVLETLSHLLELCTSYFSVKLGEQLLEHLKKWKDTQQILLHQNKHLILQQIF
jgi:transformation/transcription domain-associated protein